MTRTLTPKQREWYQRALADFAREHNHNNGAGSLTYCAVRLGISTEQVIEDAHALGVSNHDADITRGMTTAAAKFGTRPATGYAPRQRREERQTFPGYVRRIISQGGEAADLDALRSHSPVSLAKLKTPQSQTAGFLLALYEPTDLLHIFANGLHRHAQIGRDILTRDEWLDRLRQSGNLHGDCIGKNPLTGKQGENGRGEPSHTSRDCIAAYRYALIEFDALPLPAQCAFWLGWISDPQRAEALAALTFSGGKSLHGLIRTGADALTAPKIERDLRDLLCADQDETRRADPNTLRPHGGTRLAGATRMENGNAQPLIYLNPHSQIAP